MGKTYRRDNEHSKKYHKEIAKRKIRREKEEIRWKEDIPDRKKDK